MTHRSNISLIRRAAASTVVCLATAVSGCSNLSDSVVSAAFVDPAKYDLYDCAQLRTARTSTAARLKDLNGLADKARTGAAGAAVAEVAYGNDIVTTRAQAKLLEDVWQRNSCDNAPVPPQKPDPAAAAKDLNATGQRNRSGVR
jgi:hypothetical protein